MPDDIDTSANTGNDTPSTSEPSADNATIESSTTVADTQSSDPTSTETPVDGVADATNQPNDGANKPLGDTSAATTPENPYEKQYKELQGWSTRLRQQNLELQRKYQELENQFKAAQQKQTNEISLRPWDEKHPEHKKFLKLVDQADYFNELMQGEENPEIVKALQNKQVQMLGDQGIQMLREWRDDVRNQERERRLNPKAFYAKLIRQESEPVVRETLQTTSQNYQMQIQARDQAQKWIQGNPEVATPDNIKAVLALMEKGTSFDQASAVVERDHYRKQVSDAKKVAASAGEKERLLQGQAAGGISRNPNSSKRIDVQKHFKEKGLVDERQRIDELFRLDQEGLL